MHCALCVTWTPGSQRKQRTVEQVDDPEQATNQCRLGTDLCATPSCSSAACSMSKPATIGVKPLLLQLTEGRGFAVLGETHRLAAGHLQRDQAWTLAAGNSACLTLPAVRRCRQREAGWGPLVTDKHTVLYELV